MAATAAVFALACLRDASAKAPEATIRSYELELRDNGALSIFSGNVVLTQEPYTIKADRMTRKKSTGTVVALGRVRALRAEPGGGRTLAVGERAIYRPTAAGPEVELWDHSGFTHWETAADTMPVKATADHFLGRAEESALWARGNVRIHQGKRLSTVSEEAKFNQKAGSLDLWGTQPVEVSVRDSREPAISRPIARGLPWTRAGPA